MSSRMPVSIARWVLYGGFVYGVSVKSVRLFSWYKNWYLGENVMPAHHEPSAISYNV